MNDTILGKNTPADQIGSVVTQAPLTFPRVWLKGVSRPGRTSLNANQLTSLSAMIAYIAHKTGQSEFRVERNLSDHFGIANAKMLSRAEYDHAIRYLADLLSV